MSEVRQANRIRQALNHGIRDISPAAARRLEAARHLAISRQKTSTELAWAGAGAGTVLRSGGELPYFRQILAVLALLLGMWISFYWHSTQYISALEEVDSALLADDLPPEAFLDDDFLEWLTKDTSLPD